jgi:hypothetical protein
MRRSRQPKMSNIAVRATAIRIGEMPLLRGQRSPVSSYAKSRGLFTGVSIEGASLSIDDDANASFYNSEKLMPELFLPVKKIERISLKILSFILLWNAAHAEWVQANSRFRRINPSVNIPFP